MYSISDLNAMSDADLTSIAHSMNIKKIDLNNKEDLIYSILDQQAIEGAASSAASSRRSSNKTNEVPEGAKKRGRKKKTEAEQADKSASTEIVSMQSDPETNPDGVTAKKKPGRKRKPSTEGDIKSEAEPETDVVVENVENSKSADNVQTDSAPKRRGRPRKQDNMVANQPKQAEIQAEAAHNERETELPEVSVPLTTPSDVDASGAPLVTETPVRNQGQGTDPAFSAFFPRSEGRKFVPRSHDEREASRNQRQQQRPQRQQGQQSQQSQQPQVELQPASGVPTDVPATPIVIGEPVQLQQLQQNAGRKNKKNKQGSYSSMRYDFANVIETTGVLDIEPQGYGYLRSGDFNYMPSPDDIFLSQQQIRQYALKEGDVVECTVRPPRESDKHFQLGEVKRVNGRSLDFIRDRVSFEHLTPLFPEEKFDITSGSTCNISTRVVDMFSPIGKGQRGLIVAPPKTGKTILLKDIANAIAENHPETYIMILLIDERPEEVTDMQRSVNAEVIASTFDEPAERHVRIAGLVMEKAKRMVECGHDVVILLDSITRLARAYNTCAPASGKILSGGVDANALQKPKRFFGAARNIEGGGSLTIIATALTETSSKMDEVIFEEFKGTGNMELQLDRKLSNKRIFPAVDIMASSTRRDDLLLRPETLNRMWILRRFLSDRNSIEAMEFIQERMERTRDNDELLRTMGD